MLLAITAVCVIQPLPLIIMPAKCFHDPVASNDLFRDLGDFTDRILDPAAVATKRDPEEAHEHRDDGNQDGDEDRKLRAVPDHHAKSGNHGQHVAYRDRNDARDRLCHHFDVVGHARQQRPGSLCVEKTGRQAKELVKQLAAQITNNLPADPAE